MHLFTLAWLSLSAFAAPPKSMVEGKTTPNRMMVLICYGSDEVRRACESIKKMLADPKKCDPMEVIEPTDASGRPIYEPTAEQVAAFLKEKNLPANVPVLISGHGVRHREWSPAGKIESISLSIGRGIEDVPTDQLLKAIGDNMQTPSIWLSACQAGLACSPNFCMGATCAGDQSVTMPKKNGYINQSTLDMLEVMCNKDNFAAADKANDKNEADGKVTGPELTRYYCEKKQYHPFEDVYINTRVLNDDHTKWIDVSEADQQAQIESEKKKLRKKIEEDLNEDLPALQRRLKDLKATVRRQIVDGKKAAAEADALKPKMEEASEAYKKAKRDKKPEKEIDRLREAYNDFVDEYNRLRFNSGVGDKNQNLVDDLESRIQRHGFLRRIYGDDLDKLMAAIQWKKIPGGFGSVDARTGDPVDYQLRAIFPNPDSQQACVWTGRKEYSHPQLENFAIYYEPSPRTAGGGASGTTDESHAPGTATAPAPAPEKK